MPIPIVQPRYGNRIVGYAPRMGAARRKVYRKLKPKKSKKYSKLTTTVVRGPDIISDRYFVKLRFSANYTWTGSAVVDQVWRGNSLFDPDQSGIGAQPRGFDQLSNFYGSYRVMASRLKMQHINQGTMGVLIGTVPQISSGAISSIDIIELPYVKHSVTGGSGGNNKTVITNYMTTKKMYGEKSVMYEDAKSALVTANPTDQWYWHMVAGSLDGVTALNGYSVVTITYYVVFEDRKFLAQS